MRLAKLVLFSLSAIFVSQANVAQGSSNKPGENETDVIQAKFESCLKDFKATIMRPSSIDIEFLPIGSHCGRLPDDPNGDPVCWDTEITTDLSRPNRVYATNGDFLLVDLETTMRFFDRNMNRKQRAPRIANAKAKFLCKSKKISIQKSSTTL